MKTNTFLIIIQRSNGGVLLSGSLISQFYKKFKPSVIDLLVNEDTLSIAKTLPFIRYIHTFSYAKNNNNNYF